LSTRSELERVIGRRRYREFKLGLKPEQRQYTRDIFRFDVELRSLVMKSLSIIEIVLQNQIIGASKPQKFDSFGHARRVLQELPTNKQFEIAQRFGCSNGKEFRAVLRVLNDARNRAAHHERIWNCKLDFCLPVTFKQLHVQKIPFQIRDYSIAGALSALMILLSQFPEILEIPEAFDNLLEELPIDRSYVFFAMGFEER
jgi:abortive infection bacteriophage resistance protein